MTTIITSPIYAGFHVGAPLTAPTLTPSASGGSLAAGTYQYAISYVTSNGETLASAPTSVVTTTNLSFVTITNIPISSSHVTSRKIYRSKVNGNSFFLLKTISDNITTTYVDKAADPSLPSTQPPLVDTADHFQTMTGFYSFTNFPLVSNASSFVTLASAATATNLGITHYIGAYPTVNNGLGTIQPLHPVQVGLINIVKNTHATNNAVLQPSAGNTLSNATGTAASITLAPGASVYLISTSGTNWNYM